MHIIIHQFPCATTLLHQRNAHCILREVATLRRTEEQESDKTESHSSDASYVLLVPLYLPPGTNQHCFASVWGELSSGHGQRVEPGT